jgi:hypothetical protein
MTVAGYPSLKEDVIGKKEKCLKYNPSGVPPPKGDFAKL